MKSFIQFLNENKIFYNDPNYKKLTDDEHNETIYQSHAIKSGNLNVAHKRIAKAINGFAKNKKLFFNALQNSTIKPIEPTDRINNSDIGKKIDDVVEKEKGNRVKSMIKNDTPIDRPIVLRHTDKKGNVFNHLLSGNTRATAVGYGIEAHYIDV